MSNQVPLSPPPKSQESEDGVTTNVSSVFENGDSISPAQSELPSPLQTHTASGELGGCDSDDDPIHFLEHKEEEVSQHEHQWNPRLRHAYNKAREADQDLQRKFRRRQKWHSMAGSRANQSRNSETKSRKGCQEVWFLAADGLAPDRPYYAFDSMVNVNDESWLSAEAPEELSALFPRNNSGESAGQESKAGIQLIANFRDAAPGHYTLHLRTKRSGHDKVAARFTARILVQYFHSGDEDIYYTRFVNSSKDEDDLIDWRYLEAEDQFEIRPHIGEVQVNVRITQDDSYSDHQRGQLWIRSLKLVPLGVTPSCSDADSIVYPRTQTIFVIDTRLNYENGAYHDSESHDGSHIRTGVSGRSDFHLLDDGLQDEQVSQDNGVLTRLVSSKNGDQLATLTVFRNKCKVQVWCMEAEVDKNDVPKTSRPESSSSGIQTSIAQDLKVAEVDKNGVQKKPRPGPSSGDIQCCNAQGLPIELAISDTGEHIAVYQTPNMGDWREKSTVPSSDFGVYLFRNTYAPKGETVTSDSKSHCTVPIYDDDLSAIHGDLPTFPVTGAQKLVSTDGRVTARLDKMSIPENVKHSVGYATFVGKITSGAIEIPARFVYCNGLYLDVFELQGEKLLLTNSIPLVNMSSSLERTVACKLMIRSIARNMFLWIEENGRYCSTWDLSNGSAIGRIEITGLQVGGPICTTGMSVACNQSIIAIVGDDNSITTVDASSGMTISRRHFSGRTIEGITFPNPHSPQLLAMTRGENECFQTIMILDPFRLEIEGDVGYIPPLSRTTTFVNLSQTKWPNLGVICRINGHHANFYTCKALVPSNGDGNADIIGPPDSCEYELKIVAPKFRRGQDFFNRQIEIWRKANAEDPKSVKSRVFSFIPEPWELAKDVRGKILPTGDRFVVYGSWSVQLWSLPTSNEPQCRLLFYGGHMNCNDGDNTTFGKYETEVVLESYHRFSSSYCHQRRGSDEERFQACAILETYPFEVEEDGESKSATKEPVQFPLPSYPVSYADSLSVTEYCIKSVLLLAMTHSLVTSESQELQPIAHGHSWKDHASSIIDFVNAHINHSIENPKIQGTTITVLTHLLQLPRIANLAAKFIVALLEDEGCPWIPRNEGETNPITQAINNRNSVAVRAILDYCTRKAIKNHPTYIMPLEHVFEDLTKVYPEHLMYFFKKAAYIPAQHVDFNETYVTISKVELDIIKQRLTAFLFRRSAPTLEKYNTPIITFQLRDKDNHYRDNRIIKFSGKKDPKAIQLRYDWKVYAVPFPSLILLGKESRFFLLAGNNYFDSPVQLAILNYKWWQYGLIYWSFRYMVLFIFYGIFTAMTITQMRISEAVESPQDLQHLYLDRTWLKLIIADLVFGCGLLIFEFIQFWHEGPSRYLWTLFNYIDLSSIIFTIACLSETIQTHFVEDRQAEDVPQQFSFTIYAIIAMYLHLVVELRVFQPVGVIVNIIVQIMKKIRAFFLVFTFMVIAFTHSMVYLLYVYQTECTEETCERPISSDFPYETFPSFAATFFFLAGRYDPVEEDFKSKRFHFLILMVLFYFLCSIVLLTVLIAQASDAFDDATKDGEQAWRRQLSETLSEAEMVGK
ncbi:hypothetical protein BGW41_005304 [Actinomortierella wolfii]|nr:hypothetical protein BGW41_005304 [Actinomortierella wolfii]